MQNYTLLRQQAINAAKQQNWDLAIDVNNAILQQNKNDLEALNRLGLAYFQTQQTKQAKKTFSRALEIDKNNKIALKHLNKIKQKQSPPNMDYRHNEFIEEPGKAKNIELHRLSSKHILDKLYIGQQCCLVPKNRYISVETEDGVYIGSLPEDLSFRLAKLIKNGNQYSCIVHSQNTKQCIVHIKETRCSAKNIHTNSFPISKHSVDFDDNLEEKIISPDEDILISAIEAKESDSDNQEQIEETLKKINT